MSKTITGEPIDTSQYNIMWVLPTVWMEVTDVVYENKKAVGSTLVMSSEKKSENMTAPGHTIDSVVYNYLALGVYEAGVEGTEKTNKILNSRPGEKPDVEWYGNNTDMKGYAKRTGVDTGHSMMWNFYQWQLYRFCSLAVMQNFDSQEQIGKGNVSGTLQNTGATESFGPYFGTSDADSRGVKLFIENPWGNAWQHIGDTGLIWGLFAGQRSNQLNFMGGSPKVSSYKYLSGYGTAAYSTVLATWGLPTESKAYDTDAPDYVSTTGYNYPLAVGGSYTSGSGAGLTCQAALTYGAKSTTRLAFVFQEDASAAVKYDHSGLKSLLEEYGMNPELVGGLPKSLLIAGHSGYEQLPDIPDEDGFRHVGWIIDDKLYTTEYNFVKKTSHTAKSVWIGLPAVTYDHKELIAASGDPSSVVGLSNGIEIKDHSRYEQLPNRNGFKHVGWLIGDTRVGPTDPFVTRQSHEAVSLWSEVPTVIFSHSNLTDIVGSRAEGISDLETSMLIEGNSNYPKLPDTAGYRHIGWDIGGTVVGPTAGLVIATTHEAKSLWAEISDSSRPIPIFPDDEDDPIEIVIEKDSEPWLGRNGKSVLLLAVIAAIVAELAVLAISRKR